MKFYENPLFVSAVVEQSDGCPEAIGVLAHGVTAIGWDFYLRILRAGLRGSEIMAVYEYHSHDISAMYQALAIFEGKEGAL